MRRSLYTLATCALAPIALNAQFTPPDADALEGVIVERYYVADENDAADEDGSAQLVPGATTYRVFLDMKDGYNLQVLGGFVGHALTFNTTTTFFNNEDRGESWGDAINDIHLDKNTVAIDSWLCMGAASDAHWGILKSDDPDGSVVGGTNNDGGSNGVPGGLLSNSGFGSAALTEADGLLLAAEPPPGSSFVGMAPDCFNTTGNAYSDENFGLAVLGDLICPTPGNKILVGQFTTDGVFSFCLNVWLKIPDSLVCDHPDCRGAIEYYPVVNETDTIGADGAYRFPFPTLCYSSDQQALDCLGVPGGSALPGTECDDNDPLTANDTWTETCDCEGVTGIEELTAAGVSIFPNPTRDMLQVNIERLTGASVALHVIDLMGAHLISRDLGDLSGTWNGRLDLSALPAGVYVVEVRIGEHVQQQRITKF